MRLPDVPWFTNTLLGQLLQNQVFYKLFFTPTKLFSEPLSKSELLFF